MYRKIKQRRDKTPEQALRTLQWICARCEKSSGDAMRLMWLWRVPEEERPKVLQQLIEEKFIDDTRYAKAYVSEKTNLNGWGAYRVRRGLRMKGVANEIIDEKLEALDPEVMTENLERKLEKKLRQTRTYKNNYDLRNKLIRHGLSLGYDYPSVRAMVDKLMKAAVYAVVFAFIALLPFSARAESLNKTLNPSDFIFPIRDVAGLFSSNFGELRPGHFHSGIDIKTDGVVGKPVVAAANGYIARIAVTAGGFGRAIYIAHPNGTTTVYAHLDRFRNDIEKYVYEERYRTQQHEINLFPPADKFPVKQGEQFAHAGNSGSSSGPHLHYEIRDSRTQRTLNMIAQGVIRTRDNIPPRITRLYYVAVDSIHTGLGVAVPRVAWHMTPQPIEVVETTRGVYRIKQTTPVPVDRHGYFVLEVIDRKNDVSNSFGVWRTMQFVDDVQTFEYRMDGFLFDQSRYCNAVSYFPLQRNGNEFLRLARLGNTPTEFYPVLIDRGIIAPEPGQRQQIRIETHDDSGNKSTLSFPIVGVGVEEQLHADIDPSLELITNHMLFHHTHEGLSVQIPAGALYEPTIFHPQPSRTADFETTTVVLSPIYPILTPDTPLHRAMTVTIRTDVPENLRRHACLALVKNGKASWAGGRWRDGAILGSTRSFGEYCVVADTLPPKVTPSFAVNGTDPLTITAKSVSFSVSDNFSGLKSYSATLNGKWILLDRNPMKGTLTHTFDDTRTPKGHTYTLEVVVTDNCGNNTVWRKKINR